MIESFKFFELQLYEDAANKIQIKYPSTWDIQNSNNSVTLYPSVNLSPKDNLTIYSYNSTKLFNSIIDSKNKSYTENPNYEFIGQSNNTIYTTLENSTKSIQLSYRKDGSNNFNIIITEILTKYKDKIYSIAFQTKENRYGTSAIPQNVIDTISKFRIIDYPNYDYVNKSSQGVFLRYPSQWNFIQEGTSLIVESQEIGISLVINSQPVGTASLYDVVNRYINDNFKVNSNFTDFKILESYETTLSNKIGHSILFSFEDIDGSLYKTLAVFSKVGIKYYIIEYLLLEDRFASYLPTIREILEYVNIHEPEYKLDKTGIPVGGSPVDISINTINNKIYVAVPESRSIQVIDGSSERILNNITIGAYPNSVAVDSINNKIYVASPESDMLYIIDGVTNNITHKIKAGTILGDLAIDTNEFEGHRGLAFVASTGTNSISVVDGTTGEIINTINTTVSPFGIAIDPIKNRAFVTSGIDSVDVIDYQTDFFGRKFNSTLLSTIKVGNSPFGISQDPSSSRAYVANSAINNVSVIDTNSNHVVDNITVGLFPSSVAFNEKEKKLYVATGEGNVSIIDTGNTDKNSQGKYKISKNVKVDSIPYDIAINPNTNTVYLANYESKTISSINGITDNRTTAVLFNIFPANAGKIECNKINQNLSTYIKLAVGIKCNILAEKGFAYDSSYDKLAEINPNYTINHDTFLHLFKIFRNVFANPIGQINSSEIVIDHYGEYTYNLLSFPSIISSASIYLSFGTLVTVIALAVIKPTINKLGKSDKKYSNTLYYPDPENEEQIDIQKDNTFSKAEIIGFDVAVIAGILIFLTISEGFESEEQLQISMITATIVFPFAISAVFAITDKIGFSTRLMIAGFINLMIAVLLLAIMKIYQ
jgi:YVTN family beta-propeller protein